MKAEIISIGTELLLGQITNSNSVFLGQELTTLGIDCYFQTTVGDNQKRIAQVLTQALNRADLIITTGGLGPTSDDLTHESLASFFTEDLEFDQKVLDHIANLFKERNKVMSASNKKQAYKPKSAEWLANPVGTAPGIIWNLQKVKNYPEPKYIITFPGVPKEMKAMWQEGVFPFLQKIIGDGQKLFYQELKFYGISESALTEKVQNLINLTDPTVAPLAGKAECRLRIATKAYNQQQALQKLESTAAQIKAQAGEFIYGYDQDTLESVVATKLIQAGLTLSIAESCTGGLLSQRLTSVPGSSAYTNLNLITYSNQSKVQLLKVNPQSLQSHGAVSQQVALEMAQGLKQLTGSDLTIAITGIAGPDGGTEDKPVGTVYLAISYKNLIEAKLYQFGAKQSREHIRWLACQEALNWLRQIA